MTPPFSNNEDLFSLLKSRLPVVLQTEASECGLSCLAMVANFHGNKMDLRELRQRFSIGLRGTTLKNIVEIATQIGFNTRPVRIDLDELGHLQIPCILHWNMNHFVVLKAVKRRSNGKVVSIDVHDPARGLVRVLLEEISSSFTGVALELTPTLDFVTADAAPAFSLKDLFKGTVGVKRGFLTILCLAISLEFFALLAPFFMQLVVDSVLLSGDRAFLLVLALGFGLLAIVESTISAFRSWTVLYISTTINIQWVTNVFTHLLHLPMNYFEKRHLGDVVSRFNSVQAIQQTLSTSFVEAIIDGLLVISAFAILLAYDLTLATVVAAAALLYALLRALLFSPLKSSTEQQADLKAREQSIFLESIRGIQAIKIFGKENDRRMRWNNALTSALNQSIRIQKMMIGFGFGMKSIGGLENVLIILIGATSVLDGKMSIGMLFAFMSYKTIFSGRAYSLIDKALEFKMLDVQTGRLADIVLTAREEGVNVSFQVGELQAFSSSYVAPDAIKGRLEGRGIWFRYSENDPWIIRDLNIIIEEGKSTALTGSSGCGKTTLLKILLGLLPPTRGEVLIDGCSIKEREIARYRSVVSAVMQDDQLLAGTVAENVCFFDLNPDWNRIEESLRIARLLTEIMAMPMKLTTLIGDMGTSLSGGQKQRMLLARALYKNPKVLFLDEATSHLDSENEYDINSAMQSLKMTRLIVAHRAETIASADYVYHLKNGQIVPMDAIMEEIQNV